MDAVIVTHNSAPELREQLRCAAIRRALDRIVVVDNRSSDASAHVAAAAGADVIRRDVNDSLSAAINIGVRNARADFVAILNPDVLLDDDARVERLLGHFQDPSVGAVAPALRLPDGAIQDSARVVPTPWQLVQRRVRRAALGAVRSDRPIDVDWIVAAFLVVRRTAFEDVGGFDERFRLYFEDVDFCVRLWSRGWTVRLDPEVVARHEHHASSRSFHGRAFREHVRSAALFFARNPDLMLPSGRARLVRPRPGSARRA